MRVLMVCPELPRADLPGAMAPAARQFQSLRELGLSTPAMLFNGAVLYCPREQRLLEERTLSELALTRALDYGREHDLMTISMLADKKLALKPEDDWFDAHRMCFGIVSPWSVGR